MILTVTLNAALDITYEVAALHPGATHRIREVTERPGGKGLNVARVLAALGHEVTVTGFAGGPTGRALREQLAEQCGTAGAADCTPGAQDAQDAQAADDSGGSGGSGGSGPSRAPRLRDALVGVAGTTRRTVAVVDAATGETTQLNEAGPVIAPDEWTAFTTAYEELLGTCSAVALCGSLPPGVPVGAYARLVRAARAASVPVLLDTSGEPLRRAVAARPDIVKPNADELAELTGSHEPAQATRDARRRGAHAVVASLGPRGMFAVTPEGRWRVAPPRRLRGSPVRGNATGAGDSAVAGLLSGLVDNLPWPKRLVRAAALSAATVLSTAAGEFDRGAYREMLGRVEVTEAT
ncbi:sugar kinase [Streptomyces sulfonofaciens]|uniref:Sugar kinase n=1 Tax=Streptomyces sulfonofaciens TaxID=68272 RepID=A0A919GJT3_9ACTN|nr:1-phosphofructokinase family hexose kinase [Streptomyces sulfonofaciens]GHH85894.1 sugar kinase [Streptomyces sulfonofaciens]